MKKLFGILLVAALLLPVLAGCQSSETQQPPVTTLPPVTTQPPVENTTPLQETTPATQPAVQYITPDEAKTIALKDAGLKETDVRDLEVELDRDGAKVHYDVDFDKGSDDYDYEIDAVTGDILRVEKPVKQAASSSTNSSSSSSSKQLSKAEAKAIALKHAGVKESEVRDLEVELDKDDGTVHYDVDFEKDGYDYEYEIDATSGKILKSQKERD